MVTIVRMGVTLKFRVYEKIRGLTARALDPLKKKHPFHPNEKYANLSRPLKTKGVSIIFGKKA